jgi:hypothetical protein
MELMPKIEIECLRAYSNDGATDDIKIILNIVEKEATAEKYGGVEAQLTTPAGVPETQLAIEKFAPKELPPTFPLNCTHCFEGSKSRCQWKFGSDKCRGFAKLAPEPKVEI